MVLNKVWISNSQFIALLKDFHTTFKIIIVRKKKSSNQIDQNIVYSLVRQIYFRFLAFYQLKVFFYS